jgi:hypothetical protein
MSRGILVFARNNEQVDYVKQAYFLALRAKEYLGLPVSVATDSSDYVKNSFDTSVFDQIIDLEWTENYIKKRYHDGTLVQKQLYFKNDSRSLAYDISPYTETLLLDTDVVISDSKFLKCFEKTHNFQIYSKATDLTNFRDTSEFDYISETGVKFYWATCVFFRKTPENKIFFDLLQHIQEEWEHYRAVFQIKHRAFRNDHAFSIAIHIMNGYQTGDFAKEMPGKLFYTLDKDILWELNQNSYLFLMEKENYLGEYTPLRFQGNTVHVMNKFSLNRIIDQEMSK